MIFHDQSTFFQNIATFNGFSGFSLATAFLVNKARKALDMNSFKNSLRFIKYTFQDSRIPEFEGSSD